MTYKVTSGGGGTRTLSQSPFSFIPSSFQPRTRHQKRQDVSLAALIPAPPAVYQSIQATSVRRTELLGEVREYQCTCLQRHIPSF